MQESGPKSPKDEESSQTPSASEDHSGDAFSDDEASAPVAAQAPTPVARRNSDPVVRWLMLGIFAVIILWLAGMLSAMMFGLFNPSGAPRTATERNLDYYSSLIQSGNTSAKTYSLYIDTLIQAGQLAKAQTALNQALLTAKTDKSYLLAEQAQLFLAKKDYQSTVTAATTAMTAAEAELKAYMANNVANNRVATAGATLPDSYSTAALAKASALVASKQYAAAVKAYDDYLKAQPTDSDILVQRGLAKIQTGDKAGAAADFRTALKYIPDYQPALDGLKQIGAAK